MKKKNILGLKDHSINELLNDKAVYRTAPATPGLSNIQDLQDHDQV